MITKLICFTTDRAVRHFLLTGLTDQVSAKGNGSLFLCHLLHTHRAVAQLTYLVIQFQEHLGQMGYIRCRSITDLLGGLTHIITSCLEVINPITLNKVALPTLFCFCFQRPLLAISHLDFKIRVSGVRHSYRLYTQLVFNTF